MTLSNIINLIRIRQWYKNLVVFLALFFSKNLFTQSDIITSILAFFAVSFISSTNYIINDIYDVKDDKKHPEKSKRPLAAGKISKSSAIFFGIIFFIASIALSWYLGKEFLLIIIALFVLTQCYTFFLKKTAIIDIISIATFFVLRAIAGAVSISVWISPWLILCPFFLSLFLSSGKRHADMLLLKEKASSTRTSYKTYTLDLTNALMIISTTLLVISYALYSFLSVHQNLIYTLPFALFVIFRYFHLISSGSEIARHPEKVVKDIQMIIGTILWAIVTAGIIYF